MEVTAKLNYLHISPRKVRAVINVVKGMSAKDAIAQLKNYPNRASKPLEDLIKSAIANAEHNFSILPETLKIKIFKADGGPVFKRFLPGSKGRVAPIRKKTSHITLILEGDRGSHDHKVEKAQEKEITSEIKTQDIRENQKKELKKDKNMVSRKKSVQKKSGSGFVKKMFQRKAI